MINEPKRGNEVLSEDEIGEIKYNQDEYDNEEYSSIVKPFDPNKVDIDTRVYTIQNVVNDINDRFIELHPEFQRSDEVWSKKQMSRLIESLILSIPLPSFYFDVVDDNKIEVVDGLQRLTAISRFVKNEYQLKDLEYLAEFENNRFNELNAIYKRKILNTNINCYVIRKDTDENVKNSIFTRLNTGGEPLTPAEIKNAMFRGQASDFIKEMADTEEFKMVTRNTIKRKRMLDREYVNRFFAMYFITSYNVDYSYDTVMIDALKKIRASNKNEIKEYKADFLNAMKRSYDLFGEIAFRKATTNGYSKINRALYECTTVSLSKLSDLQYNRINKEKFIKNYNCLLHDKEFVDSISHSTFERKSIETRYNKIGGIIKKSYD